MNESTQDTNLPNKDASYQLIIDFPTNNGWFEFINSWLNTILFGHRVFVYRIQCINADGNKVVCFKESIIILLLLRKVSQAHVRMNEPSPVRLSLILSVLFFLHISHISADIQTVEISNDTRQIIEFETFGFTSSGHISLSVSSVSIINTNISVTTNSSRIGFYLLPIEVFVPFSDCILDSPNVTILSTLSELSPPPHSSLSKTISIKEPEDYIVGFASCILDLTVSMIIHLETYNLDTNGKKDYLPVGETQIPTVMFLYSAIYIAFFSIWIFFCCKNKPNVKQIHILMAILLVVKALNLFFAAESKYHIKIWGVPRGWDTLFYTFQFIRGLLFFVVTVLIGTGWSLLKPFLQQKEKLVLMVGIPIQLLANFAYMMMAETEAKNEDDDVVKWYFAFFLVDTVCFILILFPVSWSIRTLRSSEKMDGRAVTNLKKLRLFRDFYVLVYFYTFSMKGLMYALKVGYMIDYRGRWKGDFYQETATLCFYIIMFYFFRPHEGNQYLALAMDDEEEEVALATIMSSEFDGFNMT